MLSLCPQVTSGVVILARNKPVARRLTEQIQSDSVRKEYLALVVGTFPAGPTICEASANNANL